MIMASDGARGIMAEKRHPTLIWEPVDVRLASRRDLAMGLRSGILGWRDYPALSGQARPNQMNPGKRTFSS